MAKHLNADVTEGTDIPSPTNFNNVLADKATDHLSGIEKLSQFFGTIRFIQALTCFFAIWVAGNLVLDHLNHKAFDPYPFLFISTLLNITSAYTTPILLAADKAQRERDSLKADHEHDINTQTFQYVGAILKEVRESRRELKSTIIQSACECPPKGKN